MGDSDGWVHGWALRPGRLPWMLTGSNRRIDVLQPGAPEGGRGVEGIVVMARLRSYGQVDGVRAQLVMLQERTCLPETCRALGGDGGG